MTLAEVRDREYGSSARSSEISDDGSVRTVMLGSSGGHELQISTIDTASVEVNEGKQVITYDYNGDRLTVFGELQTDGVRGTLDDHWDRIKETTSEQIQSLGRKAGVDFSDLATSALDINGKTWGIMVSTASVQENGSSYNKTITIMVSLENGVFARVTCLTSIDESNGDINESLVKRLLTAMIGTLTVN